MCDFCRDYSSYLFIQLISFNQYGHDTIQRSNSRSNSSTQEEDRKYKYAYFLFRGPCVSSSDLVFSLLCAHFDLMFFFSRRVDGSRNAATFHSRVQHILKGPYRLNGKSSRRSIDFYFWLCIFAGGNLDLGQFGLKYRLVSRGRD